MKISLRDKWCRALRGQDGVVYQQGKDFLRTQEDKYCCLGVLMDITGAEWVKDTGKLYGADGHITEVPVFSAGVYSVDAMLAEDDMDEVGLKTATCVELASLNDAGKTFLEIADVIERNSLDDPIDLEGDDSEQPGKE